MKQFFMSKVSSVKFIVNLLQSNFLEDNYVFATIAIFFLLFCISFFNNFKIILHYKNILKIKTTWTIINSFKFMQFKILSQQFYFCVCVFSSYNKTSIDANCH